MCDAVKYTCNSKMMSMVLECQENISLGNVGVMASLTYIQSAPGFPEHEFLSFS